MALSTDVCDDNPEAWARAVRTLLRRSLRNDRPAPEKSDVLREASHLFDDYRGHVSVTAETLLHMLAGRLDRRRTDAPAPRALSLSRRSA